MAQILYLRLDSSYDLVWDPNVALQDLQAVEQAIQTRLLLLEGEWFENLNEGTPLFQQILGAIKTTGGQTLAALALTARIQGTPFVSAVQNVTATVNSATRALSFSATAQTNFGTAQVAVSPAPGQIASLGS